VPQERREDGLTSTPRQWGKRGGWGKVTMISRRVEISLAGGVVAMVHGPIPWSFFFFFSFFLFFFLIMRYLFLGTKSLVQR